MGISSEKAKARFKDESFLKSRGNLLPHERTQLVIEIQAGKSRAQAADDWLLSIDRINHIISEHNRGVNSRGKKL
jgi:hypothetical protein